MGNGVDEVEAQLLGHQAQNADTDLLIKGTLVIIRQLKELPCDQRKREMKEIQDDVNGLKKTIWKWIGAISAIVCIAGLAIGILQAL